MSGVLIADHARTDIARLSQGAKPWRELVSIFTVDGRSEMRLTHIKKSGGWGCLAFGSDSGGFSEEDRRRLQSTRKTVETSCWAGNCKHFAGITGFRSCERKIIRNVLKGDEEKTSAKTSDRGGISTKP